MTDSLSTAHREARNLISRLTRDRMANRLMERRLKTLNSAMDSHKPFPRDQ